MKTNPKTIEDIVKSFRESFVSPNLEGTAVVGCEPDEDDGRIGHPELWREETITIWLRTSIAALLEGIVRRIENEPAIRVPDKEVAAILVRDAITK